MDSKAENGAETRDGDGTASRGQERGGERVLCDNRTRSDQGPLLKAVHTEALVAEQRCVPGSQLQVACSRAGSSKTCAGLRSIPQRLQNPAASCTRPHWQPHLPSEETPCHLWYVTQQVSTTGG